MMKQAQGMLAANPVMAPQMEQVWKAQEGLLDETEAFTKAWYDRRHEAARSALETVRKINGDGADPAAAMQAITDWQRHSIERMTEDIQQFTEMCSRCVGRIASAETQAAEDALEEIGERTKSAAGKKHATPV